MTCGARRSSSTIRCSPLRQVGFDRARQLDLQHRRSRPAPCLSSPRPGSAGGWAPPCWPAGCRGRRHGDRREPRRATTTAVLRTFIAHLPWPAAGFGMRDHDGAVLRDRSTASATRCTSAAVTLRDAIDAGVDQVRIVGEERIFRQQHSLLQRAVESGDERPLRLLRALSISHVCNRTGLDLFDLGRTMAFSSSATVLPGATVAMIVKNSPGPRVAGGEGAAPTNCCCRTMFS